MKPARSSILLECQQFKRPAKISKWDLKGFWGPARQNPIFTLS